MVKLCVRCVLSVHQWGGEPEYEADDVIIASVQEIDARYAVVVVSSDKRVREGAQKGGANVLHSEQLVALFPRA